MTARRLILDVSSLARWTGPPVGIVRVEHALAARALRRPGTALGLYDGSSGGFAALRPEWAATVTGWAGAVAIPPARRSGWRRWVPSRRPVVAGLERLRLTTGSPALAGLADIAQRAVLAPRRHGHPLRTPSGERLAYVPADLALGADLAPGPGDVVFSAGSDWYHLDAARLGALRRARGFRYAAMCYDLIPLTHPRFYDPADTAMVRRHWLATLAYADLLIVTAHCIAEDVRRLRRDAGLPDGRVAVLPLGFDPPPARPPAPPPAPLEPGRYALFVSTVEPRKGHALLLRVWRRLLARGVPQRHGFRLVCVGRPGWMLEAVLRDLADGLGGTVLHLRGLPDAAVDALVRHAAFCLYPSAYEGFGLPVVEAFARGKAVLASTGGALPETVGDLSPCLDPEDDAAWEAAMAEWIERPAARATWEARIAAGFAWPDWGAAADAILDAAAAA